MHEYAGWLLLCVSLALLFISAVTIRKQLKARDCPKHNIYAGYWALAIGVVSSIAGATGVAFACVWLLKQ